MSEGVPRKRPRLEASGEKPGGKAVVGEDDIEGVKKDGELWYEDGTIILLAGDTAFKVYRGLLSDHSAVFEDMFSFPQPETSSPASSFASPPCPVVHLQDSPAHLKHVLLALMPRRKEVRMVQRSLSYPTISACIRLGHKYQMDALVKETVSYLRTRYPDDYDAWKIGAPYAPVVSIGVINLARLVGADALLPVAFMECCKLGPSVIDGFTDDDGTHEYLSPPDLKLCIQAQQALIEARVQAMLRVIDLNPIFACSHYYDGNSSGSDWYSDEEYTDRRRLKGFYRRLKAGRISDLYTPDAFQDLLPLVRKDIPDLCSPCLSALKTGFSKERRSAFKRLPELIGVHVEGWGQKTESSYSSP